MIMLFASLYVLATIILGIFTYGSARKLNMEINIHNLPLILIYGLMLFVLLLILVNHTLSYLIMGLIVGFVVSLLLWYGKNYIPDIDIKSKNILFAFIMCLFFWAQILLLLIFLARVSKEIEKL